MALCQMHVCRPHYSQAAAGPSPRCAAAAARVQASCRGHLAAARLVCAQAAGSSAAGVQTRRLILLRHADSEAAGSVRDHDRPISVKGREEAQSIAKRLAASGWLPDIILASNSKRTKDTLDAMTEVMGQLADADAHYLGSLYTVAALDGQTRTHLEECIRSIAGDTRSTCIMCVGHNKGWEEAASAFAQQNVRLNTACAALLECMGHTWEEVTTPEADWTLVQVLTP